MSGPDPRPSPSAHRAGRPALELAEVADAHVAAAIDLIDAITERTGVAAVDEAERDRLQRPSARAQLNGRWRARLAWVAGAPVGYLGVVAPAQAGGRAVGDVTFTRGDDRWREVLASLLRAAPELAGDAAGTLELWLRDAAPTHVAATEAAGYALERRLGVLGRHLDAATQDETSAHDRADVRIRAYRPDVDDDAVVAVLAAAYAGTDEAGWDLARFHARRGYDWFRAADLLVAEDDDGRVVGLHWCKQRGAGVGEVYNLAVHPDAQGRGLGPLLLGAGLSHLAATGCTEAVLWVDLDNAAAVGLYRRFGFVTRSQDVAVTRGLPARDGPG